MISYSISFSKFTYFLFNSIKLQWFPTPSHSQHLPNFCLILSSSNDFLFQHSQHLPISCFIPFHSNDFLPQPSQRLPIFCFIPSSFNDFLLQHSQCFPISCFIFIKFQWFSSPAFSQFQFLNPPPHHNSPFSSLSSTFAYLTVHFSSFPCRGKVSKDFLNS